MINTINIIFIYRRKEEFIMELENKKYTCKEIAEWFEISPNNFSKNKEKRLEELSQYAEFKIGYTPKGRISFIEIINVKVPIYGTLDLKKQFLIWVPEGIT